MKFFGFGKNKATKELRSPNPKVARRVETASRLLQRARDVADHCEGICDNENFRQHAIALGNVVTTAVATICFTEFRFQGCTPFYSDIWTRTDDCFDDLASFLAYWFVSNELPVNFPDRSIHTKGLLGVAATIFTASSRAQRLIARYVDLVRNPDELRDQRILLCHPGSNVDEVRGIVFAYIVNEAIGGSSLEIDVNDVVGKGESIDPACAFWFRSWIAALQTALIELYRDAAQGSQVALASYNKRAQEVLVECEAEVAQIFGS